MTENVHPADLINATADIVSAYVSNHQLPARELSELLSDVHRTLVDRRKAGSEPDRPTPAVDPKKSVFKDYIICLEDGKKFKSLKRHLRTDFNLSPQEYREKWGLPNDYPMVAPSYAATRSELAKKSGFGNIRRRNQST